jgi:phage tail sheath gpL-like
MSYQFFPNYNTSNINPGAFVDPNPQGSNTGSIFQRVLLVGQMLSTGSATAGVPFLAASAAQVATAVGIGSVAYAKYINSQKVNLFNETWVLPVADASASTAAYRALSLSGTAVSAGAYPLMVNGRSIPVAVSGGDTASVLATAVGVAVNAVPDLTVTASVSGSVVTFTANNNGVLAGQVNINVAWFGAANGEFVPAGITYSIGALTPGVTDPDLTSALAALGQEPYDYIDVGYTTTTPLASIKSLLNDQTGRWSWLQKVYGTAYNAIAGTYGSTVTFGLTQNDHHINTLGVLNSPSPTWEWSAQYTGLVANRASSNAALPLHDLVFVDLIPPTRDQRLTNSEANGFLYAGISTILVGNDGTVTLNRSVTNYQTDAAGNPDIIWRDTETDNQFTVAARRFIAGNANALSASILVQNGNELPGNPNVLSPNQIAALQVSIYQTLIDDAICQDMDTFKASIRSTQASGGTVLEGLMLTFTNQYRILAQSLGFSKP